MGGPLPTVNRDKLPLVFHEPHVYTGFRPLHQPWKNYILSLFQWHNEVMNVWTHLLALIVVVLRAALWSLEFDLVLDPYMWPLAVGIATIVVLYTCSSCAHCFSNRSELTHYTCFMCDYAGIGLYGFGSTILHYWYCLHEDFLGSLSHQLATPVGALLGVLTCVCCSISKTKYKRPYPFARRVWQMSSVLAIYLWLIFPIWYKLWLYMYNGEWESSFRHHIQQMLWFTLGGFFFGTDIPQRFYPGKFDLLGHSHQLFHVCIFMTTFEQMNAIYLEMTDGIHYVRRMEAPTWLNTWGAFWFVVLANAVVVYCFHTKVREQLEMEALKKQDGDGLKTHCHENVSDSCDAAWHMNGAGTPAARKELSGVTLSNDKGIDKSNAFSANDIHRREKSKEEQSFVKVRNQVMNNHNGCKTVNSS
ncbi:membrane progestin receptor beta-like [Elysia marginata]|uniref:Membrane progestin receptor beta-like n=1 Tax=Elysia marginata TaxID=1093978 RepID=A0AAV4I1U7_9GAST|nr:membrane progestin receptor beta-like [Elysia marginata]